jgi:hypothetical protein
MRTILGGTLLAHGVAHLVGFVVPWRLVTSSEVPYRTTLLGVEIGPAGVRVVGLAWLLAAILFVALAASLLGRAPWPLESVLTLVGVSVALCVLGLPESRPGLVMNAAIVCLLVLGWFLGTYPRVQT